MFNQYVGLIVNRPPSNSCTLTLLPRLHTCGHTHTFLRRLNSTGKRDTTESKPIGTERFQRCWTKLGINCHEPRDHVLRWHGHDIPITAGEVVNACPHALQHLSVRWRKEGGACRKHHVDEHTYRPEVSRPTISLAKHHLWSHRIRAAKPVCEPATTVSCCEAKVTKFKNVLLHWQVCMSEQHVFTLNVTMHDTESMKVGEG
mmetsp:Transcript_102883/g.204215  ORF Transcript_102883/g.204215 Transcript_102883/m.204215 type:complete len:202 (+) Transcript_102883:45-650(+)